MNGTVAGLRCRYSVLGDRHSGRSSAARLDRVAVQRVPQVMTEVLERALAADPAVYVVRELDTGVLWWPAGSSDERLARRWGEHLARALLRHLAGGSHNGEGIVRFDDEADYIARFLAHLVDGTAWDRWYYRPFRSLRAHGTAGAAAAVLAEQDARLPAVLAAVHRRRALEGLLALLDEATLDRLWRGDPSAIADAAAGGPARARPLFLVALWLADRLELWDGERPDAESLWRSYVATDPAPPSWRDASALTASVVEVLRLLGRGGHVRRPPALDDGFRGALDLALSDLDWLDIATLRSSLLSLLAAPPPTPRADPAPPPAPASTSLTGGSDGVDRGRDDPTVDVARPNGSATAADDPAESRSLFLAALGLVDRLELWAGERPDAELLWRSYVATDPAPASWWDAPALAVSVADVLRLLVRGGHVRRPATLDGDRQRAAVDLALRDLDWLDVPALRSALLTLLTASAPTPTLLPAHLPGAVDLPGRPSDQGPTPRQRQLLADLVRLLAPSGATDPRPAGPRLDAARLDTSANALLVHSALVAAAPEWADDPMARTVVERLLAAAARLAVSPAPREAARHLSVGDAEAALRLLPAGVRPVTSPAYRFLTGMGEEAVVLAAALAAVRPTPTTDPVIWSGCAGVFLLLRAALDARLPFLVEACGYPPIESVLLALGLRWAGTSGTTGGEVDPGLRVLAGLDRPVTVEEVRATWARVAPRAHRRWRRGLSARLGIQQLPRPPRALGEGRLGVSAADAVVGGSAAALLRAWACWVRGFSTASLPFLLDTFVRRPGQIVADGHDLLVRLPPRPLDVALSVAGYTDDLDFRFLARPARLRFEVTAP